MSFCPLIFASWIKPTLYHHLDVTSLLQCYSVPHKIFLKSGVAVRVASCLLECFCKSSQSYVQNRFPILQLVIAQIAHATKQQCLVQIKRNRNYVLFVQNIHHNSLPSFAVSAPDSITSMEAY